MTTWILLRGLTRECRHWGPFPALLEAAFPGLPVLPLELPGSGRLHAEPSPPDIAGIAARCREQAAALGAAPPYRLLGHSLGGMVATAWASAHPQEVAALVLVSTSFARFSPLPRRLLPRAWPALLASACRRSADARERLVLGLISSGPRQRPELIGEWAAIRRSSPVRAANALRQLRAAARFRAPAAAPAPALVLVGAADRMVHPDCSRAIAQRWGCPLAVHPEAGHDLPLDDGPWVVRRVQEWLALPPPSAGPAVP
jgi:pimeloyl-ACP methyl ester carboxylesterase